MGRLHLAIARPQGAGPIGLVDVSAERLAQAEAAGAAWTSESDRTFEVVGPQDVVFVTAGTPGAVERAMDLVADGGTVVLCGAPPKDLVAQVAPDAIHHHEISVVGVLNQEPEDWRTAAGLISAGTIAADLDGPPGLRGRSRLLRPGRPGLPRHPEVPLRLKARRDRSGRDR